MKKLWLIIKNVFGISSKVVNTITKVEKVKEPTQLELYRQFGEEVLIDCGIDLRNVLIKPSYDNRNGILIKYSTTNEYNVAFTTKDIKSQPYNYSNTLFYGETYMILPEIIDLYTLCVWLHEIGHYMQNHINDKRPTFIQEYEAEMYVKTMITLCPIEKSPSYYNKNYPLIFHEINLTYYMKGAQNYVKSYIEKEKTLPNTAQYYSNDVESFITKTFEYPH